MINFQWKDEYSVQVEEIDKQHKEFVKTLSNFYNMIIAGEEKKALLNIFNDLLSFAVNHFETEEKYFREFNYSGAEEHIKEHNELKEKLLALKNKADTEPLDLSFELIDYLEDWLVNHMATMDQKYVQCFHEHGLK